MVGKGQRAMKGSGYGVQLKIVKLARSELRFSDRVVAVLNRKCCWMKARKGRAHREKGS